MHQSRLLKELEKLEFSELKIAMTLSDYLEDYNLRSNSDVSRYSRAFETLKYFVKYFNVILKSLLRPQKNYTNNLLGHLFVSSNKRNYDKIISPLVQSFENTLVISPHFGNKDSTINTFNENLVGYYQFWNWYSLFSPVYDDFDSLVSIYFTDNDLYYNRNFFKYIFAVQTTKVLRAHSFIANNSIKSVIVDFDRSHICSPFILVANQKKIPTYTFIHGVPTLNNGYFPFIALNIFIWGNHQRKLFEKLIEPHQHLFDVGKHWQILLNRNKFQNVIIALNGDEVVESDLLYKWDKFANILKSHGKILYIRPHPANDRKRIIDIAKKFKNITLDLDNGNLSYDILVCSETSFAFDAVYGESLVLIFENYIKKGSLNEFLLMNKVAYDVGSMLELEDILFGDNCEIVYKLLIDNIIDFKREHWSVIGKDSLSTISKLLV